MLQLFSSPWTLLVLVILTVLAGYVAWRLHEMEKSLSKTFEQFMSFLQARVCEKVTAHIHVTSKYVSGDIFAKYAYKVFFSLEARSKYNNGRRTYWYREDVRALTVIVHDINGADYSELDAAKALAVATASSRLADILKEIPDIRTEMQYGENPITVQDLRRHLDACAASGIAPLPVRS